MEFSFLLPVLTSIGFSIIEISMRTSKEGSISGLGNKGTLNENGEVVGNNEQLCLLG